MTVQEFVDKWELGWNVNTCDDKASRELEAEMKKDLEEMMEDAKQEGITLIRETYNI